MTHAYSGAHNAGWFRMPRTQEAHRGLSLIEGVGVALLVALMLLAIDTVARWGQ